MANLQYENTDRVLSESRLFTPSAAEVEAANITAYMRDKGFTSWDDFYAWSIANPEAYWADIAAQLHWFKPWTSVFEWTEKPFFQWFAGGTTNICYNSLDRHRGTPVWNKVAFHWEGEEGATRAVTYADLYREVNRFAAVLRAQGVKRGDRVTIYMPRIPEMIVAMLATVRLGAAHSVVYGGFAAQALRERIDDAESNVCITVDGYYFRGKIVDLKHIVDDAVIHTPTIEKVIVVQRGQNPVTMQAGRDIWYHEAMASVAADVEVPCEQMDAEDRLYLLYTSGTTGRPKGVVHVHGGYQVGTYATMRFVFDVKPDDVYWCTADPGWVTGHSYIVYGPLMVGATSVFYEGAPTFPDPGRWWSLVKKYKVTILYTAPTAIRALMALGDSWPAKYDLSSLRLLGSVGEPINPEAWVWYRQVTGDRLPIMDTWWQTETGSILISPTIITPLKPGSATRPMAGIEAAVVDKDGHEVGHDKGGFLIIRRPWPSMMRTIYRDPERYESYWTTIPGLYFAGDACHEDADGYFWIQGRVDDVIKKSGYRLGSMEIESSLVSHPAVAEAAVIGKPDPVKGESIKAFVILRGGQASGDELIAALRQHVREQVGPIAVPEEIEVVPMLPKTRSGKIMRRVLKARELGQEVGDLSTLEA
ncbi:MAG: acetate--CoA ligase [Chloroflexi bacterium]|nr:acetate--CoA ligase [Chloroflexota bacterium]